MSDLPPTTNDLEHTQVNLNVAADIPAPTIPLPRKHVPVSYVNNPPPPAPPRRTGLIFGAVCTVIALLAVFGIGTVLVLSAEAPAITPTPIDIAALPTAVDARIHYDPALLPTRAPVATALPTLVADAVGYNAWNGSSRLTVLVMGLDRRPGYTGLGYRTDTMMLVSIDPATNSVGILSIPRDLYVNVPGYSALQRINTPMVLGEYNGAGGGPELAMQTVEYNFGIRVQHYVVVDFEAVTTLVDAIGGVDINVPHPIADYQFPDMYDGYDPLVLNPGLQHMDGYTALKYARTRHGDSDFQRAERQQQVLFAVRDKVLSENAIPSLLVQAPSLYGSLSQDISTDLSLDELIQLGLYLKDVPLDSIETGVIGIDYVMGYTTPEGAQVLVPNRALLADLFTEVFGANYGE